MLNKVTIDGYKSIYHADLELRPINILIGSNGVGKTNFISFFRLINIIYEQRLHNYHDAEQCRKTIPLWSKANKSTERLFKSLATMLMKSLFRHGTTEVCSLPKESSYYQSSCYSMSNIDESYIKDSTTYRDKWLREYLQSYKIFHFHDTSKGAPLRSSANINDNRFLKTDGSNLPAFSLYAAREISQDA